MIRSPVSNRNVTKCMPLIFQVGTQAILDALKTAGDGQAAFLKKLAADIMEQNSNQHQLTQQAAQASAREQVGFNLAGYLDDFSKALSVSILELHSIDCGADVALRARSVSCLKK